MALQQIDHRIQEIISSPRFVKLENQKARGLLDYDGIVELETLKQQIEQLKKARAGHLEKPKAPSKAASIDGSRNSDRSELRKPKVNSGIFSIFSKPKQVERFQFVSEDHLSDKAARRYQKYMQEIGEAEEDEVADYEDEDPFSSGDLM